MFPSEHFAIIKKTITLLAEDHTLFVSITPCPNRGNISHDLLLNAMPVLPWSQNCLWNLLVLIFNSRVCNPRPAG